MGFNFPDREELKSSVKADIQGILKGSNPFLSESFLNAFASAEGFRLFDFYEQLREEIRQIFWDTAQGEFLERPAAWFNVFPLAATRALGNIVVQGLAGTAVPVSQTLTVSGVNYTTQNSASISSLIVLSVLTGGLTSVGTTATVVTASNHGQVTGLTVEIGGADQTEYNGTFTITVTALDTFTYIFAGSGTSPATGAAITSSFANTLTLISLDRGGTIVTAETAVPHNQATGITVTIGGADQPEYNGTFIITVTSTVRFTYTISDTPVTPATGDLRAAFLTASVQVLADQDSIGAQGNQLSGTALTFTSAPIPGIESTAFVDFTAITGGNDNESQEAFRLRFLQRVQNPVANFNVSAITKEVLGVPGNTRVFIQEAFPDKGQVTIFFVRDNDGVIPTPADVTTTKDAVLTIKPAHTAVIDVIVNAPTPKVVDFIFTALSPNTNTMQQSVISSLEVFFEENTQIATDIDELAYQAAIFNTIDVITGDRLLTFTLSAPIGDISVATGEIGILGNVTFNI